MFWFRECEIHIENGVEKVDISWGLGRNYQPFRNVAKNGETFLKGDKDFYELEEMFDRYLREEKLKRILNEKK